MPVFLIAYALHVLYIVTYVSTYRSRWRRNNFIYDHGNI